MDFKVGLMIGCGKTEMLFQNGKWVLPGTGYLKHESGISVDIISRVAEPSITNQFLDIILLSGLSCTQSPSFLSHADKNQERRTHEQA